MKYSRDELAELLGVDKKTISAWCSPTKKTLIYDIDNPNFIDDDIAKNMKFIRKKVQSNNLGIKTKPAVKKRPTLESLSEEKNKPIINDKKEIKTPIVKEENKSKVNEEHVKYMNELNKLDLDIKKAKLAKEKKELILKDLDIEKKKGDFISTQEAINLFKSLSIEKDKAILSQMERLVQSICDRENVSIESAIKHKAKVIVILNEINTKGKSQIQNNL